MPITIDASNQSLGRLASQIAYFLRGKHRPDFTPHQLSDELVVVTNIDKITLTGAKRLEKKYLTHSGYLGHLKQRSFDQIGPEKALRLAVWSMLPKNRLKRRTIKRLTIINQ